VKPELEN